MTQKNPESEIAIVGLAGHFPGAAGVRELWDNLCAGHEAIQPIAPEELEDSVADDVRASKDYVPSRAILDHVDQFDAEFFGFMPREAELTDPQQRVLLECAWEALEDAGYSPRESRGRVGAFFGSSINTYLLLHLASDRRFIEEFTNSYQVGSFPALVGNGQDFLATRISYKLNLRGPAMTVQSACSTSLLAVAQACQALRQGHADMALAGGVSISFPQKRGYLYQQGGMVSPDGHCRPFDANAQGTVFGSGAGVVVLKRAADAIADGDHIYALIRGIGINNDGSRKVGYAAPSIEGQAAAIAMAYQDAGIAPGSVSFVECHGTGTPLGDPIEIQALDQVFSTSTDRKNFCTISSIKGNIGHLDVAAGVTGLIKTAMCFEQQKLPGTLHYSAPNANIDVASSPFHMTASTTPWPRNATARRAGVSAFGVGGTNVHLVTEEPPLRASAGSPRGSQLLVVSALNQKALDEGRQRLATYFQRNPDAPLADAAYTLAVGRQAFPYRAAVVVKDTAEAAAALSSPPAATASASAAATKPAAAALAQKAAMSSAKGGAAFLFPGQGSQYPGMGAGLYESEPLYRATVDHCAELLQPILKEDIRRFLLGEKNDEAAATLLRQTRLAQTAIFVTSYAVARLWMSWGIQPASMLGHSVGELAAACLAGVLSLEDALFAVATRGSLMQSLPGGSMLAVRTSEMELQPLLSEHPLVSIAAVNSPAITVVAGPTAAIDQLQAALAVRNIQSRPLHTSHAFHSAMVEPVIEPLAQMFAHFLLQPPRIPIASSVTGEWLTPEQATSPEYWARHCRETVRFSSGLKCLLAKNPSFLLECGAGNTLSNLARQQMTGDLPVHFSLPSADRAKTDSETIQSALGGLWQRGLSVNWDQYYSNEQRHRLPLPTYAFQRKRHWVEVKAAPAAGAPPTVEIPQPILQTQQHSPEMEHNLLPRVGTEGVGTEAPAASAHQTNIQETGPIAYQQEPEEPMTMSSQTTPGSRLPRLVAELDALLEQLSGIPLTAEDSTRDFLELGFDSLFLTQLAQDLQRQYAVKVSFRQLLNDFSSVEKLAQHLDGAMAPDKPASAPAAATQSALATSSSQPAQPTPSAAMAAPALAASMPAPSSAIPFLGFAPSAPDAGVAGVLQQQMQIMSELFRQQLQMLGGAAHSSALASAPASAPAPMPIAAAGVPAGTAPMQGAPLASLPAANASSPSAAPSLPAAVAAAAPKPDVIVELASSPRMKQMGSAAKTAAPELTPAQQKFIADLIARYAEKTKSSKAYTQRYRQVLADPRAVNGFRAEWKEMTYSIVVERAKGSKLWDSDGNEYIDLVNGFGPTMFGHGPQFVLDAVKDQVERSIAVGPQTSLAGSTAELIAELTGNERVTFCNTGSEAVMAAMRLARTVTGRDKVVIFAGDYHGQFDEVLVKGIRRNGEPVSLPAAPGIPRASVGNMVVLEYGKPEALDYLRAHADDIAAVIVEPVQSRHPGLQPLEFLQEVRRITEDSGTAFVFDEVVTGFRIHPGGAQAFFGIRADMATYGKVAGGGMPIGILAGKARFMDALDGGMWQFGDQSCPEVGVTFFAGTFVRHPLAIAATHATLTHIRAHADEIYPALNRAAADFASRVHALFDDLSVPLKIEQYGSVMYISIPSDLRHGGLLFALLRQRGVYAMEGFPLYLTTEHSPEDIEKTIDALCDSILELQSVGLLPGGNISGDEPEKLSAPLTEPQLEIMLAAQMGDEANCSFNESFTLQLTGDLDEAALQSSWKAMMLRHTALRMSLNPEGDRMQLHPAMQIVIRKLDLQAMPEADADAQLAELLMKEGETPFDLRSGPLVRATHVLRSGQRHDLVVTAHHVVCDGWSINVLVDELAQVYSGTVAGRRAELPAATSFLNYARDLAATDNSARRSIVDDYWKSEYAVLPQVLELPKDRVGQNVRNFSGETLVTTLPRDFTAQLRKAGASQGCTLFITLLGAWQMLLARLAGQDEAVVVIPAAAQSQLEDTVLVGHCVHLLPIRGRQTPGQTAAEYLRDLKLRVLKAYEHQDVTYGSLIQTLRVPREAGRLPLSEVQFNLEKLGGASEFTGLDVKVKANGKRFVNFDMFLNIVDTPDGLRLECDFNTSLYDRATIERWLGCYQALLEGILRDVQTPIAQLPILDQAEQLRQIYSGNMLTQELDEASTVVDLIRAQAAKTPDASAVEFYGRKVSYAEFDDLTDRIAAHLSSQRIGHGDLVGLYLDRSIEMVAALVAVLKTGAAYVPLDPLYPKARLLQICDETHIRMMLTLEEHVGELIGLAPDLLCLDTDILDNDIQGGDIQGGDIQFDGESGGPLPEAISSNSLAYVIFTSGSTGKPKGVEITHHNLVNLLQGARQVLDFGSKERLLAVTTLSFDIAAMELLLPLVTGGTVIVARRDDVADAARLLTLLKTTRATALQATPITWRMLIAADFADMSSLKMFCGGEGWDRALADELLKRGGRLWNMYGPTETTIWSAAQEIYADGAPVGISAALPNQRLYILDANLQLVPAGVYGELFIAGDGVARGYYNRPDLTAERFLPDAFSSNPDDRMYRTGDKVRQSADGRIEFCGRFDDQIKLRGFRIELGEIQVAMESLPQVQQAVAALRNDESGSPRLVGYYTCKAGMSIDAHALREALLATLPEYFVPAVFVLLDEFPLTENGKLNRKLLPTPEFGLIASDRPFVEPETPEQQTLAAIWREVLHLPRVSISDNLLDLGADSLHIFQINSRANRAGLPVTARQLMTLRTIEAICDAVRKSSVNRNLAPSSADSNASNGSTLADNLRRVSRESYKVTVPASGTSFEATRA